MSPRAWSLLSLAAPMGPGMAAERSKGSARVRWSPVAASAQQAAPMGQEWPLSGQRICKGRSEEHTSELQSHA